jgi:hypothetical protein
VLEGRSLVAKTTAELTAWRADGTDGWYRTSDSPCCDGRYRLRP